MAELCAIGIENYKELVLPEGKVLFNETSSDNYEVYYLKGTGNIEVTYNPNGGSVTPSVVYKNAGDTLGTQPVPVLNGHYLDGWYTDPTNGTKVDENTIVNSNVTYYVHYRINEYNK